MVITDRTISPNIVYFHWGILFLCSFPRIFIIFLLLSHQGIFAPEEERIFYGMQAGEHMEGMCSEVSVGLDYYMRWCLYGVGKM